MSTRNSGAIAWFIDNPVAANLVMLFLLITGFMVLSDIPKELLPKAENRTIAVSMSYPAASPKEVQDGIVLKIEEAIQDIEGIQHIQAMSSLGSASVQITVHEGYNVREVQEDIREAVERVSTFPAAAERLRVSHAKASDLVMQVQLYGDFDERTAKNLAHEMKREMMTHSEIKKVTVWGDRPYEIAIEISEAQLLKYNITLQQVANRIRSESINAPSGGIRAASGNILLRVEGQSYSREEFENIVLFTSEDGTMVRVSDVGTVKDDFIEWGAYAYFNGQYSVGLMVNAVEGQDMLKVAAAVQEYIEAKRPELPHGVQIASWADTSYYLGDRMSMMMENLWQGALLVFITLIFFVPSKTAFWVMTDLPVCVAGTFLMMYLFDVSFNMISLFGFIMVLGMLVNDAVIIAESVDDEVRLHGMSRESVLSGTHKVAMPAMFGVLTNVVAFLPMLFAQGPQAHWLFPIGFIFIVCMMFSLLESKFILPSHIKSSGKPLLWGPLGVQHRMQERISAKLSHWIKHQYAGFLLRCVRYRYLTVAVFISFLLFSYAAVKVGFIPYELHPSEPTDFLQVTLNMAEGTSEEQTEEVMLRIRSALDEIEQEYKAKYDTEDGLVQHVFRYSAGGVNGFFFVELTKEEQRQINSFEILDAWRARVGDIEGANVADFASAGFAGGRNLSFMLVGRNNEALELAASELLEELRSIKGVSNLTSSLESRRQEYVLHLKPQAQALGLTLANVALQVKEAFYGAEAQRIQRDHQEIMVMVRYPKDGRSSVQDLESMPIRLANGQTVPLRELVDIEFVMSPTRISRSDGETAVLVAAKVDYEVSDPGSIRKRITSEFMPELFSKYPSVSHQLEGYSLEQKKMEKNMMTGFLLAVLGIYILLAMPLKSYTQPIMIMSVIPFGIVGAIIGHGIMGYPISMMSIFGIIALSGIIVNDSLLLVDFVNQTVRDGELTYEEAIIQAGQRRFRAIFLTTITTFLGILPMTLETSIQATNMIPMAISLTFGEIFGSAITLLLIPCLYMIVIDIRRIFGKANPSVADTAHNA